MVTSTPGRMPVIAFSDDADNNTLMTVFDHDWCVALVLKDSTQHEVKVNAYGSPADAAPDDFTDYIGGNTWTGDDWNGPEFYVPLDEVVQIIIL